jgi:hypothetical protein
VVDTDLDAICDRDDVCPTVPDPLQLNTEGDAFGDACDLCPADTDNDSDADGVCFGPIFNPPAIAADDLCTRTDPEAVWIKPQVIFGRLGPPPGDDKMRLKGRFTIGNALPVIDPERYGIELRVLDRLGTVILDEQIPPGTFAPPGSVSGWKASGEPPRKWIYVDKNTVALHNGIRKIAVKDLSRFEPGRIILFVKAKDGTYPITSGQEPLAVSVELNDMALPPGRTPGRNQCGEVRFLPLPAVPHCQFVGTNLICK